MIDPFGLAFVLAGTCIVTLLQCGWRDIRLCLATLAALPRKRFDKARAKADLARQIEEIRSDGLIRATPDPIGDDEIDEATDAMIAKGSLAELTARHGCHRARRAAAVGSARAVLQQASELAPVLGLAGTLLSLGRLATPLAGGEGIASAIGLAVTTTFYGLVIAHALFMPLAGLVERRARAEDADREEVFRWLQDQVRRAEPRLAAESDAAKVAA